jgi:hypothetical protein
MDVVDELENIDIVDDGMNLTPNPDDRLEERVRRTNLLRRKEN